MNVEQLLEIFRDLQPALTPIEGPTSIEGIDDPRAVLQFSIPTEEEILEYCSRSAENREWVQEALQLILTFEEWMEAHDLNHQGDCWNVTWIGVLYLLSRGITPHINFLWGPGVAHASCFYYSKKSLIELTVKPPNEIPAGTFEFTKHELGDLETWVAFWAMEIIAQGMPERVPGLQWYPDVIPIYSPEEYLLELQRQYDYIFDEGKAPTKLLDQDKVEEKFR